MILYFVIAFINVFLHILRNILVIKSTKFKASLANCICYTFSAIVVKFIAESSLGTAIVVQATTNFVGTYIAMLVYEKFDKNKENKLQL